MGLVLYSTTRNETADSLVNETASSLQLLARVVVLTVFKIYCLSVQGYFVFDFRSLLIEQFKVFKAGFNYYFLLSVWQMLCVFK